MKYSTPIPLQQEAKQKIIRSFQDGFYEYWELRKEHPTRTHNGKGATIWNHINTQIDNNFFDDGFQVGSIWRGGWELIYLYDKDTEYIYTFMRNKNYNNLRNKEFNQTIFHYCNLLSLLNGDLLGLYEKDNEQMSLFPENTFFEYDTKDKMESILNEMTSSVQGTIKRYCLILVDQKNGSINGIEAIVPVFSMSSIYTENWNDYIKPQYDTELVPLEETRPDNSEIRITPRQETIRLIKQKHKNEAIE